MNKNINSFAENMNITVAQQANELALLTAMQEAMTNNDTFVTYDIQDKKNKKKTVELPSYVSITNRLKSLEESINTILKGKGSVNLVDGSRRMIKMNAIPKAPEQITGLQDPSLFIIDNNWFFEQFMFPGAAVEIDLTGQIEDTADRVKVVRVILNSNDVATRDMWNNNISTNSYDYISILTLLEANEIPYSLDEEVVQLPLVANTQSGTFEVVDDPEVLNRNVWYKLDNITYSTISDDGVDQGKNNILSKGD